MSKTRAVLFEASHYSPFCIRVWVIYGDIHWHIHLVCLISDNTESFTQILQGLADDYKEMAVTCTVANTGFVEIKKVMTGRILC